MGITRGTTPTNVFDVDADLTSATLIYITYAQDGRVVIEKTGSDISVTSTKLTVTLTQEETLKLHEGIVEVQWRYIVGGVAGASGVKKIPVKKILKDGVIGLS